MGSDPIVFHSIQLLMHNDCGIGASPAVFFIVVKLSDDGFGIAWPL